MKKRPWIIIGSILLLGIVIGIFIIPSLHKYDQLTSKNTRIVFFESSTYDYRTYAVIAVDNDGLIYHMITQEDPFLLISDGRILNGNVVGSVPKFQIQGFYNIICQIKRDIKYSEEPRQYAETELNTTYFGVRYLDGQPEFIKVGSNFYDADNPSIAAVENWIANWEWELPVENDNR